MPHCLLIFAAVVCLQALLVSGGSATATAHTLTAPDYVVGSEPTQLAVTVSLADGVDTSGDTVKIIFNKAFMEDAATVVVTTSGGSSPTWSGWATSAGGTILTGTLSGGSVTQASLVVTITNSFVAFPTTGEVYATAEAVSSNTAGDSTGAAYSMFNIIQVPTIALTSTNVYVGTTPTSLQIDVDAPFAVSSGEIIKVTASKAVFVASTTVTASASEFTDYVSDGTGKIVDADLSSSQTRGTSFTITLGSALMTPLPGDTGTVTVDITINGVTVAKDVSGWGVILLAAVGTDPVARFGDKQHVFELPPYVLTSLVTAPDILIQGSVFEGGGPWEQWFNRIVLTNPEQDRFLEIRMRDSLHAKNYSRLPRGSFHTLDVTMGYGNVSTPMAIAKVVRPDVKVPRSFLGLDVAFHKVTRQDSMHFATIGRFPRECVHLAGPSMHFYICSAPATEYFGHQNFLALKYAHLDMVFLEVRDFQSLTGLLPELWGVQPMSESTRATLLEQQVSAEENAPEMHTSAKDAAITNEEAVASVGGLGAENLTKACKERLSASVLTV